MILTALIVLEIVIGAALNFEVEIRELDVRCLGTHSDSENGRYWEFHNRGAGLVANVFEQGNVRSVDTIRFASRANAEHYSKAIGFSSDGALTCLVVVAHSDETNLADFPTQWAKNWLEVYCRVTSSDWGYSQIPLKLNPAKIWVCRRKSESPEIIAYFSGNRGSLWRFSQQAESRIWKKQLLLQLKSDDKICTETTQEHIRIWRYAAPATLQIYSLGQALSELAVCELESEYDVETIATFTGEKYSYCIMSTFEGSTSTWRVFEYNCQTSQITEKTMMVRASAIIGDTAYYDRPTDKHFFLSRGRGFGIFLNRVDPDFQRISSQQVLGADLSVPAILLVSQEGAVLLGRFIGAQSR